MGETPDLCIFINQEREVGACVRCSYIGCAILANTLDAENIRTLAQAPAMMNVCEAGRAKPKSEPDPKITE
jgi:hypothetical protein